MLTKKKPIYAALVLILAMLACNMPSAQASPEDLVATITAQALLVQNGQGNAPTSTPESGFTATPEFTPTNTLTPTPSVPMVSVSQNTNCRTGPGTEYDLIGALLIGQTAEVVGKSTATNYWIINTPGSSGTCWLWGNYATVTGNTAILAEWPIPPTPTPSLPAAPQTFKVHITCNMVNNPFIHNEVHIQLTWVDVATNESGYRVYRDGGLLATLGANETGYSDTTSLPAIWLIGDPPPSVTYGVEAFNGAGKSAFKDKTVTCP
ncbi:MAG: hypothetical protein K8S20_04270 [Chloroflexi bacterium]|nr:hypothetical protein [Chloroflexota bacterium]